jgi:signal transduction histidine kinase
MPPEKPCRSPISASVLHEASHTALWLESTLAELPLYEFQVESNCAGHEIAQVFEQHPSLPGAILVNQEEFAGMVSRQQLLEFLIRPQGLEFLNQPIAVLHRYLRSSHLLLSHTTSILTAAQQALRRVGQQGEPIVVQTAAQTYCLLDAHVLNIAHWQLRGIETQVRYERAQAQMIQTEKMASLGRLVDGVAHEILDPVGFIWGNLCHVSGYAEQLIQLVAAYETLGLPLTEQLADLKAEIELDYLRHDLPRAVISIQAGAERLKQLATSLQNFCHVDDVYPKPADLHECLDSILLLLKSRLSGEIQIVRHYSSLPPVTCYAGQLNQVFMNILTNAVDALLNQAIQHELAEQFGDALRPLGTATPKPQITITTQICRSNATPDAFAIATSLSETIPSSSLHRAIADRWVSIRIADNGPGLSAQERQKILHSLSLAKRAEKETSLAMSYRIVTAKHGGKLHLHSPALSTQPAEQGRGTEFEILLPLV